MSRSEESEGKARRGVSDGGRYQGSAGAAPEAGRGSVTAGMRGSRSRDPASVALREIRNARAHVYGARTWAPRLQEATEARRVQDIAMLALELRQELAAVDRSIAAAEEAASTAESAALVEDIDALKAERDGLRAETAPMLARVPAPAPADRRRQAAFESAAMLGTPLPGDLVAEDAAAQRAWLAGLDGHEAEGSAAGAHSNVIESANRSGPGGGRPDEVPYRAELEPMFGESFDDVRATTGAPDLAARGIRGAAQGSTVRFADETPSLEVVAHELAHVVQHRRAAGRGDALRGESLPGDDAEVEARAVGDRVRGGSRGAVVIRALPSAAVHFDRGEGADDDGDFEATAVAYFADNLERFLEAIRKQVIAADWPLEHPRVDWMQGPVRMAGGLTECMLELTGGPAMRSRFLPELWRPIDLWAVIDSNRILTRGAPGRYQNGKPTARGPLRFDASVADAVALELLSLLRSSFGRMLPRFIAAADDGAPQPVDFRALVTSSPIDRLWARVLADPAVLHYTPRTGAPGEAPTPAGPGLFREGLRPVAFEWMGKEDLAMWNVIRVTWPEDVTTEEVAATLYEDPDQPGVRSHHAYAIVNAAPFFVLPKTWAAKFPAAAEWASAEHSGTREEPVEAALTSTALDEAALAQGETEDAQPLKRKGKASRSDVDRLETMLWRGVDQLSFVAERLEPWKLGSLVTAELGWLQRRARALVAETPEQVARWAPVIESQQRTITEAAATMVEVLASAEAAGLAADGPRSAPVRRTLAAYAAAVGTSHLVDLARSRMVTADAERQQLMLSFVDGALAEASAATSSLRQAEGGSFGPGSDGGRLNQDRLELQHDKLALRARMLTGQVADDQGDAALDLTIHAGMVAVRARASELGLKAGALAAMLESTSEASLISAVAAAFDSRFETLPGKLASLAYNCQALAATLRDAGDDEQRSWTVPAGDDAALAQRRGDLREVKRAALEKARADLAAIPAAHGLDRINEAAIDAVRDNQIATLAINVVVMIAASIATSGIAAAAGGFVRGLAVARMGMTIERGALIGAAVDVAVDSALMAGVQTVASGDELGKATAENLLANVGVRLALGRLGPLLGRLDDEGLELWQAGGLIERGGVVLAKGVAVTSEMVISAAVAYVARRAVRGGAPPSDDEVTEWFVNAATMAIGRMVAGRMSSLRERLDQAGARAAFPSLVDRANAQAALAAQVEAQGDVNSAMRLLIENKALLIEEERTLGALAADPARAKALGLSRSELASFQRVNRSAQGDIATKGLELLPLRFAGVDEVVPGALWSGTSEQIATAIHQSRAVGLAVRVVEVGNRLKRWRIQVGDDERILEIEEHTPYPVIGAAVRRPRAAGVEPEARAILHAKATAELAQIRVTVAPTDRSSRGYLVSHEDGRRMAELFNDLNGAETIEYRDGILLRLAGKEWYFEFREGSQAAPMPATRTDAANGLPEGNVATIEIYGYSGVRTIRGREKAEWSDVEHAEVEAAGQKDPLIRAGHVAISFDGGTTVFGFTPIAPEQFRTTDGKVNVEAIVDALRKGTVIPGQVLVDNDHYYFAATQAREKGWDTALTRAVVAFDPEEQQAIQARVLGEHADNARGEHPHAYKFPPKRPDVGPYQPYEDSQATNGQDFTADCIGNCARWPRMAGIPIPEKSGRMTEYMPELEMWEGADAPIAGHRYVEEEKNR